MTIQEMNDRRREFGYSYQQVAELAGLPLSTVQKVLGGYTVSPRRETVKKLERVLAGKNSAPSETPVSIWPGDKPFTYQEVLKRGGPKALLREPGVAYGMVSSEKRQGEYTIEDYLKVPDDRRVELIDGVLYDMAAPLISHQEILVEITTQLRMFVKENKGPCRVLAAPLDVQLDRDERTMVQPDVLIICNKDDIDRKRMHGAPDLVVEILSPGTSYMDKGLKYQKYLQAGVREYWIVDPDRTRVFVHRFSDTAIDTEVYTFQDPIPVGIWDGKCEVDLSDLPEELAYLDS